MALRLFRWSDLDGYAAVIAANGLPYTARQAEEYLRQPNLTPERDCFVIEEEAPLENMICIIQPQPDFLEASAEASAQLVEWVPTIATKMVALGRR